MRARSFSHVGITVSDFNRAVRFYWEVFGCPLVGVADTPPERVRSFFGVDAHAAAVATRSVNQNRRIILLTFDTAGMVLFLERP